MLRAFARTLALVGILALSPSAAEAQGRQSANAAAARTQHRSHTKPPAPLSTYAVRALQAYQAMQQNFYIAGTGLYRGTEEFSFLWPFSQALAATVSLSHISGGTHSQLADARRALMVGLRQYLSPGPAAGESAEPPSAGETSAAEQSTGAPSTSPQDPAATAATRVALPSYDFTVAAPGGPAGSSFYDDNEWVGIELARLYELDHNTEALQQAEQIIAFVMAGWQTTGPSGQPLPCPGGVPFSNAASNVSRNTVTTAPGAELAVQLYRITHNIRYLEFAEMAYGWVRACLMEPSGLYADHINLSGSIQRSLWSYNQGSMMGAAMLLYLATRNHEYLTQARQTAAAARTYFTYSRLSGENPFFAAVYFRNLLYLNYFTHESPGSLPVREYAYYAWLRHRLSDNLFAYGSPPSPELLRQAAIVQVYALLSTSPSTYF
ncbi:MAG TPA: glycoside hydrolase family 76 protein [Solirubrobacteraceae bacterium]|jgi:hypothetical protein